MVAAGGVCSLVVQNTSQASAHSGAFREPQLLRTEKEIERRDAMRIP